MSKPVIAGNTPIKVEVKTGQDYYFCTCGRSKNQPTVTVLMQEPSLNPKASPSMKMAMRFCVDVAYR